MSMRRAVILAVTIEHKSQAEAARAYGASQATVSRWMARYRTEGDAAFEPRSTRPHSNPNQVPDVVADRIVNLRVELSSQGLDAGPETIRCRDAATARTEGLTPARLSGPRRSGSRDLRPCR